MRLLWVGVLISVFAADMLYAQANMPKRNTALQRSYAVDGSINPEDYHNIKVTEILRGDMVRLETGELLHLIGVNAPECRKTSKQYGDSQITGIPEVVLEVMGNEVIQFTRGLIENKYVGIEFDAQPRDQSGILQGYVFLRKKGDDVFVNAELIRQGYTSGVTAIPNDRYQGLFSKLYDEAKQRSRGIWRQWQRE